MALPPLNVKVGADVKDLNKGLGDAQKTIVRFATAGVAGATAVGAAMIGMTKASMANIDVLAKQARSLGLTTNAFQRMALVAEEAGVEAGKLSSMLGLMQRNIVELQSGTQKQVDTFNALGLSLSDLQGLSPDEQFSKIAASLDSITDPAEKTAAAMEVFGRSGRDAINMLNGYGAAAANAEAFQRRFGIAVSQDVSDNVERANDAVGRLGMVMQGLGNQMAGAAAPAIERFANGLIDVAARIIGVKASLDEYFTTFEQARAVLGEDAFNRLIGKPEEIIRQAEALQAVSDETQRFTGIALNLETQIRGLVAGLEQIDESGAASAVENIADQARILRERFDAGQITVEEFIEGMRALETRAISVAQRIAEVNDINLSGIVGRIQSVGQALAAAAAEAVNLTASLPGAVSTQMGPTSRRGHRAGTTGLAPTTSLRPQMPGVDSLGNFMDAASPAGGGGGGGTDPNEVLREQMATRLETLMESLMTERETVANWYAEGLELIQNSSDAELDAIGGKQEAIERLEKEHQARLSRIRELGAASDLATVLGAGNEILTAIGQNNEKALRIAKVFGAAEALISAYQGAAEALKLPFPKNIAAAASVLAKGIGFVNAIKGVSKGGGSAGASAGGGGAGAAAVAEAPQQQVQSLNFTVMSDPFGIGERVVRQIASQLNEAQRNGNTLIRANVV